MEEAGVKEKGKVGSMVRDEAYRKTEKKSALPRQRPWLNGFRCLLRICLYQEG